MLHFHASFRDCKYFSRPRCWQYVADLDIHGSASNLAPGSSSRFSFRIRVQVQLLKKLLPKAEIYHHH
jgi:hypothetical protein